MEALLILSPSCIRCTVFDSRLAAAQEPTDSFAWLRIGIAIRMAYQMYLHGQRKGPLPNNEQEARRILVRRKLRFVTNEVVLAR